MFATLLALLGAVFTAVLYAVSSERLDYGTVQRRQLDMWVAAVGFGCLVLILFGTAEVRRANGGPPTAVPTESSRPAAVSRVAEPDLHPPTPDAYDLAAGPPAIVVVSGPHDAGASSSESTGSTGDARSVGAGAGSGVGGDPVEARPVQTGASLSATARPDDWRGVITSVLQVLPLSTPPPPAPGLVATSALPLPPQDPAPTPATAVALPTEPVEAPPAPALPTPHCGDPEDIRIVLGILDAFVDRTGDRSAVGYRAEVRNASEFPVTLVDISAVVESRDVGAERFGHNSLPDVTLEPGVLHRLDGRVELTKAPPPFDLTRMCVSFVSETCGRALPYRITKHCFDTRGF